MMSDSSEVIKICDSDEEGAKKDRKIVSNGKSVLGKRKRKTKQKPRKKLRRPDGALEFQCGLCQASFCENCFTNKMLMDCGLGVFFSLNENNSSFCSECKPRDKCEFCGEWACPTCVCCTDKSCLLTGKCSGNIEKLF